MQWLLEQGPENSQVIKVLLIFLKMFMLTIEYC